MTLDTEIGAEPTQGSPSIAFLQWALPRVGLRWSGFRRVRRQVWRRVAQRIAALHLSGPDEYHEYLDRHPDEWREFEARCRVTISRFMRDEAVFSRLGEDVLPTLAAAARARGDQQLRIWSAGCASGEEPYTVVLLWHFRLEDQLPDVALSVTASDIDEQLLTRARAARFRKGSLRELPTAWIESAFLARDRDILELKPEFATRVNFLQLDVRGDLPGGVFDAVLCRNLVCTYFEESESQKTLARILSVLRPGGALAIGLKEELPPGISGLEAWDAALRIFRRQGAGRIRPTATGIALCA